jgi:hypothetical protein
MQNHLWIDWVLRLFFLDLTTQSSCTLLYQDSPSCNESQMITLSSMTDIDHGFKKFKNMWKVFCSPKQISSIKAVTTQPNTCMYVYIKVWDGRLIIYHFPWPHYMKFNLLSCDDHALVIVTKMSMLPSSVHHAGWIVLFW